MKKRKNILKEASVLLITAAMVLSTVAVTANTNDEKQPTLASSKNTSVSKQVNPQTLGGPVVWDNGMDYDNALAAQYDPDFPLDAYPADDFHFEEDQEVCDVHWIGAYYNGDPQPFDWCISFMKDDGTGNAPDSHPQTPSFAGPFCYTWDEIDKVDLGAGYYEMSVDLPENIPFPGCEKHWISIWGEGAAFPQSGWGFHQQPIKLHQAVFGSDHFGFPFWTDTQVVMGYPVDMCFQLTTKPCQPSVDVEKYVMCPCTGNWTDADTEDEALDLPICTDVTFKIVIHNNGECCGELFNIQVYDIMHDSLKFISADPEPQDFAYDPPYYYLYWFFPGPLPQCHTIEIYITAHVVGPDCSIDVNYVEVLAESGCEPFYVRDEDSAFVHAFENKPPTAPTITGPRKGNPGTIYCWEFHSSDPNGDDVQYIIDWGDGTSDTTPCTPSCTPYRVCHTYANEGDYEIKAKAKDCCWGLEGPESTFKVSMPRNRAKNTPVLQFLQNYLQMFPMLRLLVQRFGL